MSREIKFRIWYEGEMRYGAVNSMSKQDPVRFDLTHFVPSGKSSIVMKFTGLKDESGNDIYEGDILYNENTGDIDELYIVKDALSFFTEFKESYCDHTVIGNIYENKDKVLK
jgi:hypothetical protein